VCWKARKRQNEKSSKLEVTVSFAKLRPSIQMSSRPDSLREFPHCPVNGQRWLGIRFFWFPFHGLTHY
jgi:hypothetical protein